MGIKTNIEWTDATWNPIRGCSKVSAGCANCYAEGFARRFSGPGRPYEGVATDRGWTGKVKIVEKHLADPLRWKKPRRIFVNAMSDLFHEDLDFAEIRDVFLVMERAHWHTFQVLTKRPKRMNTFMHWFFGQGDVSSFFFINNIWLGVSVEDQKTADERIPVLLKTPATVRFVSYEPALGPVDFKLTKRVDWATAGGPDECKHGFAAGVPCVQCAPNVDWIICGGESGPGARPCDVEWIRDIVKKCKHSGVACFVKQLGSFVVDRNDAGFDGDDGDQWGEHGGVVTEDLNAGGESFQGDPVRIRLIDPKGGEINEFPADLRVRQFPKPQ